jgi:hypothetical protein
MTAVEWLIQELRGDDDKGDFIFNGVINYELIEQAKEMEKQQIFEAWDNGFDNGLYQGKYNENCEINCGEQYYNETYNKQ